MLEMNIAFCVVAVLCLLFASELGQIEKSWRLMKSDLLLHRAARYSQALISQELYLSTAGISINSGVNDEVVCQDINAEKRVRFYVSNDVLYRGIKKGSKSEGINPISLSEVKILGFRAELLQSGAVLICIEMQDKATALIKSFCEVFFVVNGS